MVKCTAIKSASEHIFKALKALGHQVIIAAFSVPGDAFDFEDLDAKTYYLPLPSHWTIFINVVKYWLPKRKSINECLYLGKNTFRQRARNLSRPTASSSS